MLKLNELFSRNGITTEDTRLIKMSYYFKSADIQLRFEGNLIILETKKEFKLMPYSITETDLNLKFILNEPIMFIPNACYTFDSNLAINDWHNYELSNLQILNSTDSNIKVEMGTI